MESLLFKYLSLPEPAAYLLLFLGFIFEGEIAIFIGVYLALEYFLNLKIILALALIGTLIGNNLFYLLGRHLIGWWPKLDSWLSRLSRPLILPFSRHPLKIIAISKFTYGFHRLTLWLSGKMKIRWWRFFLVDFLTSSIWIITIAFMALLSQFSLTYVRQYFKYTEIAILLAVIIFIALTHYFAHRAEKKILTDK